MTLRVEPRCPQLRLVPAEPALPTRVSYWRIGLELRRLDGRGQSREQQAEQARQLSREGRQAVSRALTSLYLAALRIMPDQADEILLAVVLSGMPTGDGLSAGSQRARWVQSLPGWTKRVLQRRWEASGQLAKRPPPTLDLGCR